MLYFENEVRDLNTERLADNEEKITTKQCVRENQSANCLTGNSAEKGPAGIESAFIP